MGCQRPPESSGSLAHDPHRGDEVHIVQFEPYRHLSQVDIKRHLDAEFFRNLFVSALGLAPKLKILRSWQVIQPNRRRELAFSDGLDSGPRAQGIHLRQALGQDLIRRIEFPRFAQRT